MLKLTCLDFPFQTSNAALALALYGAGIPFHDREAPLTNTYDADTLRRMGYKGAIEAAMLEAYASGQKGHVEYGFKQVSDLGEAATAFNGIRKRVEAWGETSEAIFAELQHGLASGFVSKAEALASAIHLIVLRWRSEAAQWVNLMGYSRQRRMNEVKDREGTELIAQTFILKGFPEFAAVTLDTRREFLNLWKRVKPLVKLHRAGKPDNKGNRVRMPGFLFHCHDTNNSTRRDLGVPTK